MEGSREVDAAPQGRDGVVVGEGHGLVAGPAEVLGVGPPEKRCFLVGVVGAVAGGAEKMLPAPLDSSSSAGW